MIIPSTQKKSNDVRYMRRHKDEVLTVAFSPTGNTFASGSADCSLRISNSNDEELTEILHIKNAHKRALRRVKWFSNALAVATASSDGTAAIWDLETAQRQLHLRRGHTEDVSVNDVAVAGQNNILECADDGRLNFWDVRVHRIPVLTWRDTYPLTAVAYDEPNYRAFAAGLKGVISVYDVRYAASSSDTHSPSKPSGQELFTLTGHAHMVLSLKLAYSNQLLLSSSCDQTIRLWNARPFVSEGETRRQMLIMRGPPANFECVLHRSDINQEGTLVAVPGADRAVYLYSGLEKIWTTTDGTVGQLIGRVGGHSGAVAEAVIHPQGRLLAAGSLDNSISIRPLSQENRKQHGTPCA